MQAVLTKNTKAKNHVRRGDFIRWLRKVHGWLGLWGAVLGLLFGLSGVLLNHRAVMKIPGAKMEESQIQLAISAPQPTDAKAFTRIVQQALNISQEPVQRKPRKEDKPTENAASEATFLGKAIKQPQTWKIEFQLPQAAIRAEYVAGNQYATISREDANVFAFITRMHKGVGLNTGWILLADSLAGAMIILSITGVLLWTKMRGSRLVMSGLMGTSIGLMVLFTLQSM